MKKNKSKNSIEVFACLTLCVEGEFSISHLLIILCKYAQFILHNFFLHLNSIEADSSGLLRNKTFV